MKDNLEAAIATLTAKSAGAEKSDDAMKFAQAALNLAHALATVEGADR